MLGFLGRVSFPALHQLWRLFPWWKGQHRSIWRVSVMVSLPCPLPVFMFSLSLHHHCIGRGETVSSRRRTLAFFKPQCLFLYKTRRHSSFLRIDDGKTCSTKDSIDLLNMFSGEDAQFLTLPWPFMPQRPQTAVFYCTTHLTGPGFLISFKHTLPSSYRCQLWLWTTSNVLCA